MDKKEFSKPIIKIIEINNDQIIATSGTNSFNDKYQDKEGYRF